MGDKKMGRPTDNPKDTSLKVRLDKASAEKLDECAKELDVSKAEVVRRGIHKVHDDLKK
nr:ribbon-helix-helix protein, CopG family [uncultured Oscillibacter sp.]